MTDERIIDENTSTAIILAAINAAGSQSDYFTQTEVADESVEGGVRIVRTPDPAGWTAAVQESAVKITVMTDKDSNVVQAIKSIAKAKKFTGTVMSVKKESTSKRGVVTLHTGTDRTREGVPEGCEQVRTERTDNMMGLRMAKAVRGMIGHKILVWVVVEEFNGGQGKARVLHHFEDLGADPEFEQKQSGAAAA